MQRGFSDRDELHPLAKEASTRKLALAICALETLVVLEMRFARCLLYPESQQMIVMIGFD